MTRVGVTPPFAGVAVTTFVVGRRRADDRIGDDDVVARPGVTVREARLNCSDFFG
jgi:hypothetical protein